jgi:hypothetical protein
MKVLARSSRPIIWIVDRAEPSWSRSELSRDIGMNSMGFLGSAFADPRVMAELRRWLAESRLGSQASRVSDGDVMRMIKTCLDVGQLRIVEDRAPLQPLAPARPPPKQTAAVAPAPRVARQAPAQPPPPEDATAADAACLKAAAKTGTPLVEQG